MAEFPKTTNTSITTPCLVDGASRSNVEPIAGETLDHLDALYIKASDGKAYKATGAAANAAAKVDGFAFVRTLVGRPTTVVYNIEAAYGGNKAPGTRLFLSGTVAGGLADAASTGGLGAIGTVMANKAGNSIVFLTKSTY